MKSEKVLGRAIARLRKERGWTQAKLAELTGVSVTFIAALEHATRTPSLETIDKLCDAFRVTPSALFAAGEEKESSRSSTKRGALVRAVEALPRDREQDLLSLVHAISVMAAVPRPSMKDSSKTPRARKTSTAPRKAKRK